MEFALFGCFVFAVGLLIVGFSGGKREPQPAPAPLNTTFIFMMVIALVALLIATGSGYVWIVEL